MADALAARYREYGDPEALTVEEVPRPEPGRGEVLVEVRAAGINPIDTYVVSGSVAASDDPPAVAGSDLAGVVAETGADVDAFEPGDRVYATGLGVFSHGTLAEYVPVSADVLADLPESVSFEAGAAAAMPFATAWRGLVARGGLQLGETCLVAGAAGGVGHAGVQIADAAGATVVGLARPGETADFVRELGADAVVDYRSDDLSAELERAVGDGGLDVALETHADANLVPEIEAAARGGRVVVLGEEGPITVEPGPSMAAKIADLDVRFMSIVASREDRAPVLSSVADLLADGTFVPHVDSRFPLEDVSAAYRRLGESGVEGSVVVTVD